MKTFRLTFDVVTEASSQRGDFAYHGFVTRDGGMPRRSGGYLPKKPARFTLREALEMMDQHDDGSEPREADSSPCSEKNPPRWFSARCNDGGESVTMSLHLGNVTPATACRIARLAGVRLSR